jgi:N-acetylmuramate 1-kinase
MESQPTAFDGMDLAPALAQVFGNTPPDLVLTRLRGDASSRIYYRLTRSTRPKDGRPSSLIVMRLPADALKSDEKSAGAAPTELPFLDVQRMLKQRRIRVPEVHCADVARHVVLLEDLGDETFEARLLANPQHEWQFLYGQAVDLLSTMHARCAEAKPNESIAFTRKFERELLRWELDHFREWGLEAVFGALPAAERAMLDAAFDRLADEVASVPTGFVHRDYQSRNLMWAPDESLCVIDFQDAFIGPAPYDLVALLCDSYVALPLSLQDELIQRYCATRGLSITDSAAFTAAFWRIALQRKLKDAGRFVFIDRVRQNPDFLQWYPQSLIYVERALQQLGESYAGVRELLSQHIVGFPSQVAVPAAISAQRVSS